MTHISQSSTAKSRELIAGRIEAIDHEQKAILAAAGNHLSAEQSARFDSLQGEYDAMKAAHSALGTSYGASLGQAIPDGVTPARDASGRSYASMFGSVSNDMRGFESAQDLLSAIEIGDSRRLAAIAGQWEGIPAQGGYLVPEPVTAGMLDSSLESEVVRPRCRVIPMTSATQALNVWDDNDHSGGNVGGLVGVWVAEGDQLSTKTAKTRQVKLSAKTYAYLTEATLQLVQDVPQFEGDLTSRMTLALGWGLDVGALFGTGAGQPQGIANADSTIEVAKEVGQAAATVNYSNLASMFARLHGDCVPRSTWLINSKCIPQLLQLSIAVGTGGSHVPVLTRGSNGYEILTRPVVLSEKLKTLGTSGDVVLADLSQYALGVVRGGVMIARSDHLKFDYGKTVWRIMLRGDGMPLWNAAFTPQNGDTLSWAVKLATRA